MGFERDRLQALEKIAVLDLDPRFRDLGDYSEAAVQLAIARFENDEHYRAHLLRPRDVQPFRTSLGGYPTLAEGLLVNNGGNYVSKMLRESSAASAEAPDTTVRYDNSNARIGIGDSSTAAGTTQTDLQAASNKVRIAMDTGFPKIHTTATLETYVDLTGATVQVGNRAIVFSSVATAAVANFKWVEFGVFNSASANVGMLDRFVSGTNPDYQGTKVSGQYWAVWITITWS